MSRITIEDPELESNEFAINQIFHVACNSKNSKYIFATLVSKQTTIEIMFQKKWSYKILKQMEGFQQANIKFSPMLKAILIHSLQTCVKNGVWEGPINA